MNKTRYTDMDSRQKVKFFKQIILSGSWVLIIIMMLPQMILAASVTLSWDRNQEPDIAGYKVFWGTQSRHYTNSVTIHDTAHQPLERTYTIDGLAEGETYFFAVKAFDLAGQESSFSKEISYSFETAALNVNAIIGDNKVINASMETGGNVPDGWWIYEWVPKGHSKNPMPGMWSTQEARSGQSSLMLTNSTGSYIGWRGKRIDLSTPYPRTLTLGGWSKALNVSSDCRLYGFTFLVIFEDGSRKWFYPEELEFDTGTHDWQLRQVTKTWKKGVRSVTPYTMLYGGTGTAWFDDIFVTPSPSNVLYNFDARTGMRASKPVGWQVYDWADDMEKNPSPGTWSAKEAHSGSYSLVLTNRTGSYTGWKGERIYFAAPYPRTLTLGGWSKALNVSSSCWLYGFTFLINFEDGTYEWFYPVDLEFERGTHDWQLRQASKTWNKGVVSVTPYTLLYKGTGTAWFDDIFIAATP